MLELSSTQLVKSILYSGTLVFTRGRRHLRGTNMDRSKVMKQQRLWHTCCGKVVPTHIAPLSQCWALIENQSCGWSNLCVFWRSVLAECVSQLTDCSWTMAGMNVRSQPNPCPGNIHVSRAPGSQPKAWTLGWLPSSYRKAQVVASWAAGGERAPLLCVIHIPSAKQRHCTNSPSLCSPSARC